MSRTYEIVCPACKEALWIGQSTSRVSWGWYFYGGDRETVNFFEAFMMQHIEHQLVFQDSENVDEEVKRLNKED